MSWRPSVQNTVPSSPKCVRFFARPFYITYLIDALHYRFILEPYENHKTYKKRNIYYNCGTEQAHNGRWTQLLFNRHRRLHRRRHMRRAALVWKTTKVVLLSTQMKSWTTMKIPSSKKGQLGVECWS